MLKLPNREHLSLESSIVYLEDLIESYENRLTNAATNSAQLGRLVALRFELLARLDIARRPNGQINLCKKTLEALRARLALRQRYTEANLVLWLGVLYRILRDHEGNPVDIWNTIQEANAIVEKLTPSDWPEYAVRTLRVQRAQILQWYAIEEARRAVHPSQKLEAIAGSVAKHEGVLQLARGLESDAAKMAEIISLKHICVTAERNGKEDYRVNAKRLNQVLLPILDEIPISSGDEPMSLKDTKLAHEGLWSFVILAQSLMRVQRWQEAIVALDNGLSKITTLPWPEFDGPHVEQCQLLVYKSRCLLRLNEPTRALEDARQAVQVARDIPWLDDHLHPELSKDPLYRKHPWQNFTLSNLFDTLLNSKANSPEDEFGLHVALEGIQINLAPEMIAYACDFRSKRIRALKKLERWPLVLDESKTLSTILVQLLPSTTRIQGVVEEIADCYAEAEEAMEKLGRVDLAEGLHREVDAYLDLVGDETIIQQEFISEAERLLQTFITASEILVPPKPTGAYKVALSQSSAYAPFSSTPMATFKRLV